jgi:hypothetical protein
MSLSFIDAAAAKLHKSSGRVEIEASARALGLVLLAEGIAKPADCARIETVRWPLTEGFVLRTVRRGLATASSWWV